MWAWDDLRRSCKMESSYLTNVSLMTILFAVSESMGRKRGHEKISEGHARWKVRIGGEMYIVGYRYK